MKPRDIAYGAVLTALGIMIPVTFGSTLRVLIPPFSATIASHVPVLLSMLISPAVAAMVGISTAIGFLLSYGATSLGLMIMARAATHAIWAYLGAVMIKKGASYVSALAATAPSPGFPEALAVLFMAMVFGLPLTKGTGVSAPDASVATVVLILIFGTIAHHAVDSVIAWAVAKAARKIPSTKKA